MKIISTPFDPRPVNESMTPSSQAIVFPPSPTSEISKPAPEPSVTVMSAPATRSQVDVSQNLLVSEMRSLQDKFEQVRTRLSEQLLQHTRHLAKLSDEVVTLREILAELKAQKSTESPAPSSHKPDLTPPGVWINEVKPVTETPAFKKQVSTSSLDMPSGEISKPERPGLQGDRTPAHVSILPIEDSTERKVAFFSKLWNYLNHVAIEIPLHKKNPSD